MAESQHPVGYDGDLIDALTTALSPARLRSYLQAAGGDRQLALRIYLWNSRLAKAFLFPLNIAEVSTRNAINKALAQTFGDNDWILHPPFQLSQESEACRQKAIGRLKLSSLKADDLIAGLSFDFWSNLFRKEYNILWDRPGLLTSAFPNLQPRQDRSHVQVLVAEINHFRNRIAHHEPIHAYDHRRMFDNTLALIGLNSTTVKDWVRQCSTVMAVVRTPPSALGGLPGLPLSSTNLRPPLVMPLEQDVLSAMTAIAQARPATAFVQMKPSGGYQAITLPRLASFISASASSLNGMVDLSVLTLKDAISSTPQVQFGRIDRSASTGDALAMFFPFDGSAKNRLQMVLVTDGPALSGVIPHPQIRY